MEIPTDKQAIADIRDKLRDSRYRDAYQALKRNPMAQLSIEDACIFLNNIDALADTATTREEKEAQVWYQY